MVNTEMELFYDFMAKSPVLLGKESTELLKSIWSESDDVADDGSEKGCLS